jgi:hypothetical protein
VSSLSFSIEGEMDLDKLNFTMGALLQARGEDLYRMKGILAIKGLPDRYVFQVGWGGACPWGLGGAGGFIADWKARRRLLWGNGGFWPLIPSPCSPPP